MYKRQVQILSDLSQGGGGGGSGQAPVNLPSDFTGTYNGVYYRNGKPQGSTGSNIEGATGFRQDGQILYDGNRMIGFIAPDGSVWDPNVPSGGAGVQLGHFADGKFTATPTEGDPDPETPEPREGIRGMFDEIFGDQSDSMYRMWMIRTMFGGGGGGGWGGMNPYQMGLGGQGQPYGQNTGFGNNYNQQNPNAQQNPYSGSYGNTRV